MHTYYYHLSYINCLRLLYNNVSSRSISKAIMAIIGLGVSTKGNDKRTGEVVNLVRGRQHIQSGFYIIRRSIYCVWRELYHLEKSGIESAICELIYYSNYELYYSFLFYLIFVTLLYVTVFSNKNYDGCDGGFYKFSNNSFSWSFTH